jgi:hypothetical protein
MENDNRIGLALPTAEREAIERMARREERSISFVVRRALRESVARHAESFGRENGPAAPVLWPTPHEIRTGPQG